MCATCGCSDLNGAFITNLQTGGHVHLDDEEHGHSHAHRHDHDHAHTHSHHDSGHSRSHEHASNANGSMKSRTVKVEQDILAANDRLAERNRGWFEGRGILALNLMSSPGSGKTTLLERTIRELRNEFSIHVIEGDQATSRDGERVRAAGANAVQVNTGSACHLDAHMISHAVEELNPPSGSLLFIENVGNLVCPALFDLGECACVVIASVTEGEDKPLKYPHMFRAADLVLLNKTDLLPHVEFSTSVFAANLRQINPRAKLIEVSAARGELKDWHSWIRKQTKEQRSDEHSQPKEH